MTRSSRCSTMARRALVAESISALLRVWEVSAAIPTEMASASSFLRPCPVDSSRTREASLAGTSMTSIRSARSRVVSGVPRPAAPSMAQTYDPNYPICLQIYGRDCSYVACGYASMDQCRSSASGRAAQCIINPYYARGYINPYYARGYRRKHHIHRPK